MIRFPNAKINLGLQILGQRSDGYHEVRSILYPIGLCDVIELIPDREAPKTTLRSTGDPDHEASSEDLILRAFDAISPQLSLPPHRIHIHKRIPMGAGLGGGSADAGEVLRHFGEKNGSDPSDASFPFHRVASQLGSDIPFFLQRKAAMVSGRGERTEPIELDLAGWYLLLFVPPFSISTQEVYQLFEKNDTMPAPLKDHARTPVQEWPRTLRNDLEGPAFRLHPELKELKAKLYEEGAAYASMTGSGSGIYALFEQDPGTIPGTEGHFEWREELPHLT